MHMNRPVFLKFLAAFMLLLALASCNIGKKGIVPGWSDSHATAFQRTSPRFVRGTVIRLTPATINPGKETGSFLGWIAGGLAGSAIGDAAGHATGALLGHAIGAAATEKKAWEYTVKEPGGQIHAFVDPSCKSVWVGDKVAVLVNSGPPIIIPARARQDDWERTINSGR